MACKWQPCFPQLQVLQLSIHSPLQSEPHDTTAPHSQLFTSTALHSRLLHSKPQIYGQCSFSTFGPSGAIFSPWITHTWLCDKLSYCLQSKIEMIWAKSAIIKKLWDFMKPIKSMKRLEDLILTRIKKNGLQFFTKKNLQKSKYFFSKK